MTDASSRREHLLALARNCESESKRFLDKKNRHDADRCWRLSAVYREMAAWVAAQAEERK